LGFEGEATTNAKCGGLSTARQTMKLSVASVEMTTFFAIACFFAGEKRRRKAPCDSSLWCGCSSRLWLVARLWFVARLCFAALFGGFSVFGFAGLGLLGLRAEEGEEDDVADGFGVGEEHGEAVDADAFSGGRG
jgi:hypothetical protein